MADPSIQPSPQRSQIHDDDYRFTILYDRLLTQQNQIHSRVTALYVQNRELKIEVLKSHPPLTLSGGGIPSKERTIYDTSMLNKHAMPYSRLLDDMTLTIDGKYNEEEEMMHPHTKNNMRLLKSVRLAIATLEREEAQLEREAERLLRIQKGQPAEEVKPERPGLGWKTHEPAETTNERVARLFGYDGASSRKMAPTSDYEIDSSPVNSLVDADGETDVDEGISEREPVKKKVGKRSNKLQEMTREGWDDLLGMPKGGKAKPVVLDLQEEEDEI
ncbi:MAG: hypothetical protein Q9222_006230 [Ikaeria aurantiellina]